MATIQELERALINADAAGDVAAARDLAAAITAFRATTAGQIPGEQVVPAISQPAEPTIADRAVGAGEAALAIGTGAVGGTLGMVGGTLKGLAEQILSGQFGTPQAANLVEQSAAKGAQALTYAPRTQAGREQVQAVGEALSFLPPVVPVVGAPGAVVGGARMAAPAVAEAARKAAPTVQAAAQKVATPVKRAATAAAEIVRPTRPEEAVRIGSRESVGSAVTPEALRRTTTAEALPVPVTLTKGAATRDAQQLAFEKKQIMSDLGAPLRQRAEENNLQLLQNFDALVDMTEAASPDLVSTGNAVTKALSEGYKAAKNKTNVAYTKAKKSAESQAPVDPNVVVSIGEGDNAINNSLIGYLNEKISGVPSSAVPDTARKLLVKMGLAEEDANGNLIGKQATVGKMEEFRKELSGIAKWDDRVSVREETILKKLVDAQTDPVSGPLYKKARATREAQARKYENRAVIARLIQNVKGMDDPRVAADKVFQKSIMTSSPEEITFLKRVLNTSGKDGQQAWKELQGALVRHLKDEATKGMGMDSADRPIISPSKLHQSVQALDANGRLDVIIGKKNAQIVRDLDDVVRYVTTVPPGTLVNSSGTAGTLLAAITEAGATGALTGIPVPVATGIRQIIKMRREGRTKARINDALNALPPVQP